MLKRRKTVYQEVLCLQEVCKLAMILHIRSQDIFIKSLSSTMATEI